MSVCSQALFPDQSAEVGDLLVDRMPCGHWRVGVAEEAEDGWVVRMRFGAETVEVDPDNRPTVARKEGFVFDTAAALEAIGDRLFADRCSARAFMSRFLSEP